MIKFGTILGAIAGVITLAVAFALLLSVPLWALWNWLMPVVFPDGCIASKITLVQAFGILMLSSILFKSNSVTKNKS